MATDKKLKSIIMDIYRLLYRESTPQADFDELVKNAKLNENGEKEIDFVAYQISQSKFQYLLESVVSKHKLTKMEKIKISNTIHLGCSPKFKNE